MGCLGGHDDWVGAVFASRNGGLEQRERVGSFGGYGGQVVRLLGSGAECGVSGGLAGAGDSGGGVGMASLLLCGVGRG